MKERNKNWIIAILIVIALLLVAILFFVGDKKLELESDQVNTLYSYLGEVDIYHCGGLNTYNDGDTSLDNLTKENALCSAFYNLQNNQNNNKSKSTGTNSNKTKICKVGDKTIFKANDDTNECEYNIISKKDLNEAYNKIYGQKIKDYIEKFNISDTKTCYLEGEEYYCGDAETFTYSIGNDAVIYRLKDKAIKTYNGKIIISDYFLKISNNNCYLSNNSTSEAKICTEKIKEGAEIDAEFIREYGRLFKHTFIKDEESYYWSKSEATPSPEQN